MIRTARFTRLFALALLSVPVAQASMEMRWDPGADDCAPDQARTQAHAIDEKTIAIRQNPCVDYEAPIMYLLIGDKLALLIDSGVSQDPAVVHELTQLVQRYLVNGDQQLPLVVGHTHGHQDHRAADVAFSAVRRATVFPTEGEAMRKYFGIKSWPDSETHFDLGGRDVVIVPTPGHHADHVVFYDSRTRLLFTGDFYLPGRLLVEDIEAYRESAKRMIEFVQAYGVEWALGAHIEMDANGELYWGGASYHPNERQLAMPFGVKEAVELHSALLDFNGFYNRHPNYAISNPVRNLIAIAVGLVVTLTLVGWGARRYWKRRRAPIPAD